MSLQLITPPIGNEQEWLTPPYIIQALGKFDLDPCSPVNRVFETASHYFTILDNSIHKQWFGRVWLNPPYDKRIIHKFIKKLGEHGNGIALTFARTDTEFFHQYLFNDCHSLFFLKGRIKFYHNNGKIGGTAQAPSVLTAYGEYNSEVLAQCGLPGKHIPMRHTFIIVGTSPKWFSIVSMAINQCNEDSLKPIYDIVERLAPDKVKGNKNWKAKIRQQVYIYRKKATV